MNTHKKTHNQPNLHEQILNPKPTNKILKLQREHLTLARINFIVYFFKLLLIGSILNMFNVIQPDLTSSYNISKQRIILISTVSLITSTILTFLNPLIMSSFRLRSIFITTSLCLFIGTWSLLLIPYDFNIVYLSFLLFGVSASCSLNSIIKFIFVWFEDSKQPFYFSFLGLATLFGIGLCSIFPFMFLSNSQENIGNLLTCRRHSFRNILLHFVLLYLGHSSIYLCCVYLQKLPNRHQSYRRKQIP
jgi:sugar phosphate permease